MMVACRLWLMLLGGVLLVIELRGAAAEEVSSSALTVREAGEEPRLYEGRSVREWREFMKSLELASPAAEEAVPGLIALCRDSAVPQQTRVQAAYTLGRIGNAAESAVPVLIELLHTPDEGEARTARWAAKALTLFGPLASIATPELAKVAGTNDRPMLTRLAATEALGRIGGAHPEAIPALMQLAGDHDDRKGNSSLESQQLRAAAIDSLAMAGSPAGAAVPLLIRLTRDDAGDLRKRAASALGAMGPSAGIATEALVDLVLFDGLPEVRNAATTALVTLGEPGESALRQLLTDEDVKVRRRAAAAFGHVRRLSDASRQTLVAALDDTNADVRLSAVESLRKAGHDPQRIIQILLQTLTNPDRQPRIRAYRLLIEMRTHSAVILPRLRKLAEDERPHVRQVASKAIEQLTQPETDN